MKLANAASLWPLLLVACGQGSVSMGVPSGYQQPTASSSSSAATGGTSTSTSAAGSAGDGLPCDVASLLQTQCHSCHSNPPAGGAPMSLVTYADLAKASLSDPTKTEAQLSVELMQSATMPPGAHLSSTEIAVLGNWVAAGLPAGTCQSVSAGGTTTSSGATTTTSSGGTTSSSGSTTSSSGAYNTPPQCTSNTYWSGGGGSPQMHPGQACIACHSSGDGPSFTIAGTLYPTAHEPDNCNGTSAATIEITDAAGHVVSLTPNSAGNFYSSTSLQFPIRASVTAGGMTTTMAMPQMSGDCNSCHTQSGTSGAPGRIIVP